MYACVCVCMRMRAQSIGCFISHEPSKLHQAAPRITSTCITFSARTCVVCVCVYMRRCYSVREPAGDTRVREAMRRIWDVTATTCTRRGNSHCMYIRTDCRDFKSDRTLIDERQKRGKLRFLLHRKSVNGIRALSTTENGKKRSNGQFLRESWTCRPIGYSRRVSATISVNVQVAIPAFFRTVRVFPTSSHVLKYTPSIRRRVE